MSTDSIATVSLVERAPEALLGPIDSIKLAVTGALNLPAVLNQYWDIIDYYPDEEGVAPELALAHYNDDYDPYNRLHEPLRQIRGVIIDLKTGAVICDSHGYTQSIPCYEPIGEERGPDFPQGAYTVHTELSHYLNSFETVSYTHLRAHE